MKPRRLFVVWMLGLQACMGCNSPLMRSQSPESDQLQEMALQEQDDSVQLIGDITLPAQTGYLKLEGVGLVTGLNGTGSDPPASGLRASLVGEMQSHEVRGPDKVLASKNNALVVVKAYLPPGVQKGDRLDVKIVIPAGSKTTSLRDGYLMRCRLREMRVLDHRIRTGHVTGLAEGPVLVDAIYKGTDDESAETQGRVLGGGTARVTRSLGLVLRAEEASPRESARIGMAINRRFRQVDRDGKLTVAKPVRDNYVELTVHSRYKHNIARYLRVIRSIALRESAADRMTRLQSLEHRLLEPTSAARTALQLEAIGDEAIPALTKGLASEDVEIRFYAAEALAYLDQEAAAPILGQIAADEPAFRWHALAALTTMDHVVAYEALTDLLHSQSAETRYGAFRALRTRNPADPLVKGESLGRDFSYHLLCSDGPPLIHISKAKRPEIVLFGQHQSMLPPAFLFAGKQIMVKGLRDGRLRITRFGIGKNEDHVEIIASDLDQMIRTVARMGGGYAEVIQVIREAQKGGYLDSKVVIDAVARPNRRYHRSEDSDQDSLDDRPPIRVASPTPELFSSGPDEDRTRGSRLPAEIAPNSDSEKKDEPGNSIMGRMTGWLSR